MFEFCAPCMQKKYWIELTFRDEFNQPLSWVSGNLIDPPQQFWTPS
ncbi:hypothetical protein [Vibrio penaeicida]|uniref:Uncharacterized protein n=1 Tax=Vibrio penaeicida TaxID=104609 RepID=A0AAV5NU58_9VIBR|nr:hypothetical protein [Vibrio penaeicida]GLQ73547.1 hypothetical protein GCM10007932_29070 [Vibrio penaeicida]